MHGRLKIKTSYEQEEEQKLKKKEAANHFRYLTQRLFKLRPEINTLDNHQDLFKLSSEILLINADFYTVWNIRREALIAHINKLRQQYESNQKCSNKDDSQEDDRPELEDLIMIVWKDELSFTNDCLRKNEKSYSAWQHRIWILTRMPKSAHETEILVCNSFLAKDERNFHCWDYRSYISDVVAKRDIKKELDFTTDKIRANFSNFSAWHRRHKLLLRGLQMPDGECPKECNLKEIWQSEYDMILNALYTDPTDQSPWLYHNWLIKNNFNQFNEHHLQKLKTLEELEPDNMWLKQAIELSLHQLTIRKKSNNQME